jgi:hypothetical protein
LVVILVVPIMVAAAIAYYTRMPAAAERRSAPAVSYPSQWDPRVEAIAEFVERERGLAFKHPVEVDFLTAEQYHDIAVAGSDVEATDDQISADGGGMTDDEFVGQYRAIGLISGEVDLTAVGDTIADSGTLAFYSTHDKRVRVRGSELTPGLRVTLAHELTHALQDQTFDLAHGPSNGATTTRTIVEGDARRIEWAYAATVLTDAERDEMAASDEAERNAYEAVLEASDVPTVLSTTFELPYAVGPQFVAITAALGGNSAVDDITMFPPLSEVALLDPLRPSFGDPNTTLPDPVLPVGAQLLDRTPMGAGLLFLWLGERMEPADALAGASSWYGESSAIFRWQGRICLDADFYTDGRDHALLDGLTAWATAMPREAGAVVRVNGNDVFVHTCDPGADVGFTVAGRTEQTLTYAAIRSEIELELVRDADMTSERSACIADSAARTISAADLATDSFDMTEDLELAAAIERAILTC